MGYGDGDSTVISVAWDKYIKVHKDEKVDEGLRQGHTATSLRSKGRCHDKDITCADYHHKLGLIATGAQDKQVKLFDYETLREKYCWPDAHKSEVTLVHFIVDFPLLLTSDLDGHLYIWHTDDKAKDSSY